MKSTGHVKFLPLEKIVPIRGEASVLELALKNKIEIDNSCGGSGSCGTCRVHILSRLGDLGPRTDPELAIADDRAFDAHERLACQIAPIDGLIVQIP